VGRVEDEMLRFLEEFSASLEVYLGSELGSILQLHVLESTHGASTDVREMVLCASHVTPQRRDWGKLVTTPQGTISILMERVKDIFSLTATSFSMSTSCPIELDAVD
jgi:hypothetical protein